MPIAKESNGIFKWVASILLTIVLSLVAAWGANTEMRMTTLTARIDSIAIQLERIETDQKHILKQLDRLIEIQQTRSK